MSSLQEPKVTNRFDSFTTKKVTKSTIRLTAMISAWSASSAVEHGVSNIRERLLTVLGIDYKMEARKAGSSDRENVKQ